jgi:uncharacterized caspase-like protein
MLVGVAVLVSFAITVLAEGLAHSADFQNPGTTWAFCIGVGDYEDPDLVDLPSARNDARGVARVLETQGGFDQVIAITDDRNPKDPRYPSKKHILATLKDMGKRIGAGDTVFVFFSGQGVTDPGGQTFLLPADAVVRNIPRTGISLRTILDFLERVDAGTRILCIDGARERIWKQGPALQAVYPDRYLRLGTSAVFYAAKKGTYSRDHSEAPYGVFGRYLIEGLQGEADVQSGGNHDGMVSLMELATFVDEAVRQWSVTHAFTQTPYIRVYRSNAAQLMMARAAEIGEDQRLAFKESSPMEPSVEPPAPEIAAMPPSPGIEKPEVPEVGPPAPDLPEEPVVKVTPRPERPKVEAGKEAGDEGDTIVLAAPAPSIDEVASEEASRSQAAAEAEREQEPPVEASAPESVAEEEKPPQEPALPSVPPEAEEQAAPETAPPAASSGERATEFETEDRGREEQILAGEEAPRLASVPPGGPEELKPETAPPPPPPEPVSLRREPVDLSSEAVQTLLLEHGFYATCWTYNGDFCNPDGEFINNYKDNGNGTVTDRRTGLMWQKAGSPKLVTWPQADNYVKQLNKERFAGHEDWRLPTVAELASLMERSWLNVDLFLDPVFSSGEKYCWSADTKGVERAWKANFHLGFFLDFPMSEENSVRAVRTVR